jgi:hypothetical protein
MMGRCLTAVLMLGAALTPCLEAQQSTLQPEVRADAILGRANVYHAAAGVSSPLGNYIRVSVIAGGGVATWKGESVASARADLVGRFLIDPFQQQKWGPYAGAGVSVRGERGSTGRAYLVAMIGVEGQPGKFLVPAVELGLGGGTRIGVVLRRALRERR